MLQSLGIIFVVAICTVLTRALPFLLLGGRKEVPKVVKYLGNVLPPAIMAILVVYCIKGISLFKGSHGLPEILAIAIVAFLHIWKKNTLISIGVGTLSYMIFVQFIF